MLVRAVAAAALGWAVPGLGHVVVRRPGKALYFGVLVLLTFGIGVWLGEGASVSPARFPYHWYGQVLAGLPAFAVEAWLGSAPVGETIDRLEVGLVFTTVAGILNLIVVADAYYIARGAEVVAAEEPDA